MTETQPSLDEVYCRGHPTHAYDAEGYRANLVEGLTPEEHQGHPGQSQSVPRLDIAKEAAQS